MIKIIPLLAALTLVGCASEPKLTADELRLVQQPIHCTDKADCDEKWQKTQLWIVQNSAWKIKVANDTLIQTEGPFDRMELAFTATRVNTKSGTGTIGIRAGCGNMFGCYTEPGKAILQYRQFVLAD